MKSLTILRIREFLVVLVVSVIPVVFYRGVYEAFDLVKATLLWVGTLLIGATFLFVARRNLSDLRQRSVWPIYLFIFAAFITTFTSSYPAVSIFGQAQRYNGLLTLLACSVIAVSIAISNNLRYIGHLEWWLVISSVFVIGYGVVQQIGIDPFEWSTGSFSASFASIGNPNTASAWVSVVSVFAFGIFLQSPTERVSRRWFLLGLLGVSGPVVAGFRSFQGSLVLTVTFFAVLLWIHSQEVSRRDGLAAIALSLNVILTSQFNQLRLAYLISLVIVTAIGVVLHSRIRILEGPFVLWNSTRTMIIRAFTLCVIAVAALVSVWDKIADGFRGGFLERGDFFRAARDIFLEHPIVGTGLDTYGLYFGEFRPEGHATRFEEMRSSSAHNIYLGMFSNGGVLLGVSYVVLVFFALYVGFRHLNGGKRASSSVLPSLGGLLAYQIIALVSVEHVALHLLNFTLIGLVLSRVRSDSATSEMQQTRGGANRRQRTRSGQISGLRLWLASFVSVAMVAVGAWQFSRPYRAADKALDGEILARMGRSNEAEEYFLRSVDIYPWGLTGWLGLSQLQFNRGAFVEASDSALEALEQTRYSGAVSGLLVSIIFRSGDVDLAVESSRIAADFEPFAVTVQRQFAEVLFLAAGITSDSDPATAAEYLQELLRRFPAYEREGLNDLKKKLQYSGSEVLDGVMEQ